VLRYLLDRHHLTNHQEKEASLALPLPLRPGDEIDQDVRWGAYYETVISCDLPCAWRLRRSGKD